MDVADAMRSFVVTAHPDSALDDVEQLLLETGFAMVPVVEGDRLVGVVGLDDLPLVPSPRERYPDPVPRRTVADVMTTAVTATAPWNDLDDLMRLLRLTGLTAVPVLDHGTLVGVVSRRDVAEMGSRAWSATTALAVAASS